MFYKIENDRDRVTAAIRMAENEIKDLTYRRKSLEIDANPWEYREEKHDLDVQLAHWKKMMEILTAENKMSVYI